MSVHLNEFSQAQHMCYWHLYQGAEYYWHPGSPSYAIFLELQTWNLGGWSPLLCPEPDGFPAWEAPSGLRAGGGAETWAGILCLYSSSDDPCRRTAQTL